MHLRVFAPFAALVLAGIAAVAAAPSSAGDSAGLVLARRQLASIATVVENATAALTPILTAVEAATSAAASMSGGGAALTSGLADAAGALTTLVSGLEGVTVTTPASGMTSIGGVASALGPFLTTISSMITSAAGAVSAVPALGPTVAPLVSNITALTASGLIAMTAAVPGLTSALTPLLDDAGLGSINSLIPTL